MQSGEFTGEILTLQCQTKMWGPICEPNRTVRKYLPPVPPTTLHSTSAGLSVSCLVLFCYALDQIETTNRTETLSAPWWRDDDGMLMMRPINNGTWVRCGNTRTQNEGFSGQKSKFNFREKHIVRLDWQLRKPTTTTPAIMTFLAAAVHRKSKKKYERM